MSRKVGNKDDGHDGTVQQGCDVLQALSCVTLFFWIHVAPRS
jgi:hypothetical protein